MAGPEVGTVEDGYRFKGGNPADQSSWEQVEAIDVSSDYGPGARRYPNGTLVRVGPKGGVSPITGAATGGAAAASTPMVGADARSRYMIGLGPLQDAKRNFDEAEAEGNPIDRDWGAALIDRATEVPFLARIGDTIARNVGGEDYQKYIQAASTYESALLPILSGAAVTESEALRLIRADLPQAGDSESVLERKARNRANRINAVAEGIGKPAPYDLNNLNATNESEALAMISGGLPSYDGIKSAVAGVDGGYEIGPDGRPIAPTPNAPTPGGSPETAIDYTQTPPDQLLSLLANGGWVRQGDGEPYQVAAGSVTRSAGGREVAPGVNVTDRADWTPEGAVAQRRDMWNPARQVDAFVRGAADAGSLEFADEIAAGADALLGQGNGRTLGDRYRSNVRVQRAIDKADGEDAGFARNAGEVAGYGVAALTQGPRLLAQGARRFGSPLLNGAVTGIRNALTGGAIAGTAAAGASEGNALQRAQEALKAAPVGAVVGAAAPVAVNALAPRVAAPVQGLNRFVGRQIGRAGEALGVPGATRLTERATPSALNSAVERFGGRMGERRVNQVSGRESALRDQGVETTFIDGLDDGGQGMIRALATRQTPGRTAVRDFAEGRTVGIQDRTASQARRIVSDDMRSPVQLERDLKDVRRTNAREAMRPLEGQLITLDRNTIEGLRSDLAVPALREAAKNNLASTDDAIRFSGADLRRLADDLLDNPSGLTMTVRQAQDASKAMIDAAEGLKLSDPARANALRDLGRGLRDNARTPERGGFSEYGDWLDKYAEDSGLIDAVDLGNQFMKMEATEFADALSRLSPQEIEVARASARRAIEREAGTQGRGATTATTLASGRDQGIRSAALLGEDAPRLQQAMAAERQALVNARNADPRAGSNTNLNAQDSAVADGLDVAGDLVGAATLKVPAMVSLVRRFQARGFNDAEAEALTMAAVDPARTQELITLLSQRMTRKQARTLARAVQRQVASGTGSSGVEQ